MDTRFRQANKEALLSLLITIIYMLAWGLSAYFLNNSMNNNELMGFPTWFIASCLFVPLGFIIICYCVVKISFKNIPLDESPDLTQNKVN